MKYNHTQIGVLMIIVLIAITFLFIYIVYLNGVEFYSLTSMILIFLILLSFLTLNVNIDDDALNIKFGYGLYTNSFLLKEIESVKVVKNPWYIGWGIRFWFWPKKIIVYNVSGFDAVEIVLKDGKIYRIGTDEPIQLEKVINENIIK
ncbi:MAG: hypothetical protein Q8K30_07205 [Candidatus Gracilibacteria bacterium]|nr:hypothetical protein [Candidatus Gracilibacteria bacterium]